jgi:hypothetical protein
MRRSRRAFYGYYYWQVLYRTTRGTFLLPSGYPPRASEAPAGIGELTTRRGTAHGAFIERL